MAVALQILATGFAAGSVYGLVGVGHSLVFRLTGVRHGNCERRLVRWEGIVRPARRVRRSALV